MTRKDESLLNLLIRVPWWISIAVALAVYVLLKYVVPPLLPGLLGGRNPFAGASEFFAPIASLLCLLAGGVSAFKSWRKGRMLDPQENLGTVGGLSWKEFEELVSEIYLRQGRRVRDVHSFIDLI